MPQDDVEERLVFYSEMIDDRMEEGCSEEEAVLAIGSVVEIVMQVAGDIPLKKIAKDRIRSKRCLRVWEIVLLVLGSPIWLSLGICAAVVIFSIYVSLWSVIVSLWAVFGSLAVCSPAGVAAGAALVCEGNVLPGMAMVSAGAVCTGLSIFLFYGCKVVTKGVLLLTKKAAVCVKSCFVKKEEV